MNATDFINRISRAFHEVFRADSELFDLGDKGINEQTITFRLGLYLAHEFGNYNVDCEYNRLWDGKKGCIRFGIDWMKPDVIVHRRQSDKANLFCVEAKKLSEWKQLETLPVDIENKLRALTHPEEDYRYALGLAWRIVPSPYPKDHDAVWFIGAESVLKTRLVDFERELVNKLVNHRTSTHQP